MVQFFSQVNGPIFLKVASSKVDGYLKACRGVLNVSISIAPTLHEQIKRSFDNNYQVS